MEIGRILSSIICLVVLLIGFTSTSSSEDQIAWQLYHFNTPSDYREFYNGSHYIIPQKIREPDDDVASFLYYWQLDLDTNVNTTQESNPHRIINGHRIPIQQVPWQVALIFDGSFICGGSILTSRWIMTAAHCIVTGGTYQIRAASRYFKRDGHVRNVVLIVRHARFSLRTMNHDIALMRVNRPFQFSRYCQPVRLPKANSNYRPRTYLVSGWGIQHEDATSLPGNLRAVNVNHLSKNRCQRLYSQFNIVITRYMFCAQAPNRDSCSGDSGGALTHNRIAYGIVSFGIGCAHRNAPGVYTNVARSVPWIKRAIAQLS